MKKGTVQGNLVSVTETEVTVATTKGDVTTAKSDIREVKVKGSQTNKQLLGAGIGGASGIATAAILDGALTDGNGTSGDAVLIFGALGAAAGLLIPSLHASYKTVYKVR